MKVIKIIVIEAAARRRSAQAILRRKLGGGLTIGRDARSGGRRTVILVDGQQVHLGCLGLRWFRRFSARRHLRRRRRARAVLGPSSSGGRRDGTVVVLVILLESIPTAAGILKAAGSASEPTAIPIHAAAISTKVQVAAAEAAEPTPAPAPGHGRRSQTGAAFKAGILVSRGPCLLAFGSDPIDIRQEFGELLGAVPHVDALILSVLVNVMKLAEHLEQGQVRSSVVDDPLRPVLDEKLQQL